MRHFRFNNIVDFLKKEKKQILILSASAFFLLICGIGIKYQIFWIPYTVFILFAIYLLFFKLDIFLYLTAFLTPFSVNINEYIPSINFGLSFPSEALLVALMLIFLARVLYENNYSFFITKHPITIAIIFYLVWMFVTSVTSTIPLVSFKFLASKLWFIIPAYFFLCQLVEKDYKKSITFFLSYAMGLSIIVCRTTLMHIRLGDVEKVSNWVMTPYYNDHTAYGAILTFFICILAGIIFIPSISKKQRILSIILLIIMNVGLYLSFSRAAWLSLIISLCVLFLLLFKIKMRTVIISILGVFIILFTFQSTILRQLNKNDQESSTNFIQHIQSSTNISSDASNVERINRWTSAIRMFKEKPIFGYGPGTYQFEYAPFQRSKYRTIITTNSGNLGNAHSEYLGPLAESGLLGMLSIIVLIFICLKKGIYTFHHEKDKNIRIISLMCTLALISYFVHGFLNNFLDTEKLAIPVFGAMAVITGLDIISKNKILSNTEKHENI